jgi:hypothetical protein
LGGRERRIVKIPAIQVLPVAIADRRCPRQQRAGGILAGRRQMTAMGARADEKPIVCLGSDGRHWGLKTFERVSGDRSINGSGRSEHMTGNHRAAEPDMAASMCLSTPRMSGERQAEMHQAAEALFAPKPAGARVAAAVILTQTAD